MPFPLDARTTVVIATIVGAIAFGSGFGAFAVESSSSPGPCQLLYGTHMYCIGTVTTQYWCHVPAPCPNFGNSTIVLGYTFHVWPMIFPNGTPALDVSVLGAGASGTGNLLLSNPMGTAVVWASSDGVFLAIWTNAPPSWESSPPDGANVMCGVVVS